VNPLIVDALASGRGKRQATRDVIGAGPRAVAGVLEGCGLAPTIFTAEGFLGGRKDFGGFDTLLVSGMSSDLTAIRRVISLWRKRNEGFVLLGGPVASEPERALKKTRADLVVVGEGEQTLKEVLDLNFSEIDDERYSDIRGLAYNVGAETRFTGLRPFMRRGTYNDLKPSTRVITDYPLFHAARVYVEVLRGCSNYHRAGLADSEGLCINCGSCREGSLEDRYYCPVGLPPGCGYCSVPSLYGPPKSRETGVVIQEVRALLDMGVRRVVLSAPGFLDYGRDLLVEPEPLTDPRAPEPNYEVIEGLLSELTSLDQVIDGEASVIMENIKGNLVTERAAKILGRYLAGTPVNIGLETGSVRHSVLLGRASSPDENLMAVRRLKRAGMKPYVYFIHGLPGQSEETVAVTVKAIKSSVQAGASRIILYRFQSLPMSAFAGHPTAPPTVREPLSKRIQEVAVNANIRIKEKLVGTRLRVVLAEPYDKDRRKVVAYPLLHGPMVLVQGVDFEAGRVIEVKIQGFVSDRVVEGSPIDAMF